MPRMLHAENAVVRAMVTGFCESAHDESESMRGATKANAYLAGREDEKHEAEGETGNGDDEEKEWGALEPDEHPPGDMRDRRSAGSLLDITTLSQKGRADCIDCFHVTVRRPFTPAPMLSTSEVNQKELTARSRLVSFSPNENWSVVAVTPEKKVATVTRF